MTKAELQKAFDILQEKHTILLSKDSILEANLALEKATVQQVKDMCSATNDKLNERNNEIEIIYKSLDAKDKVVSPYGVNALAFA